MGEGKKQMFTHTMFGKTKRVVGTFYHGATPDDPADVIWIERGEDEYARMSHDRNKTPYTTLYRKDWLRGSVITPEADHE